MAVCFRSWCRSKANETHYCKEHQPVKVRTVGFEPTVSTFQMWWDNQISLRPVEDVRRERA